MSSELLPCPFCGGEAEVSGSCGYSILCSKCEASVGQPFNFNIYDGVFDTFEEAASAWNQRAERTCKIEPTTCKNEIFIERIHEYECMSCNELVPMYINDGRPNYCPWCGAKAVG